MAAISTFHGIDKKDFSGELLGGGLFLSSKYLKKFSEPLIFYDKSRELKANLEKAGMINLVEFDSRNLNPFKVIEKLQETLKPFLKNCKLPKKSTDYLKDLERFFVDKQGSKKKVIFFLGEILKDRKPPQQIMVNDGLVLYLIENSIIKTYPSKLAYVPWSEKTLRSFKDYLWVGLSGKGDEGVKILSSTRMNFYSKTALIPGWSQLLFLEKIKDYWMKL